MMLDCIKRSAPLSKKIIDELKERTQPLIDFLGNDINSITKIYLIASGTSNNAAITAKSMLEKTSGIEVETSIPNMFKEKTIYDKNALYIFISQTGTSMLVKEMLDKMNALGFKTIVISESKDTPLSLKAKCFIDMGCGKEEYSYRTIGFVTSALTLIAIGLRLGLERKTLSESEYNSYIEDANLAISNHSQAITKTIAWYDKQVSKFKDARSFIFYGANDLYGVAIEGALKVLEIAKTYLSVGYELEDGLHGPNLGFGKHDVVIALNHNDDFLVLGLANFSKNELKEGYIFGNHPIDDNDLSIKVVSQDFAFIELAPTVQILSYKLAETLGVAVDDIEHKIPHISSKYFATHKG